MSEENPYVLLWLEGPLQAWGQDSKFGVRDTLDFPTRSGVLGLVCCARGAGGPEIEWLEEMSHMIMELRSYSRLDWNDKPVLREPALCDFQMVGSGYNDGDPWQSLLIPKTTAGKKAVGGGTKMSYRYYLQDSAFAVVLEIPHAQSAHLVESLQNPVWDLYLGRKSCVPTELIYQGLYEHAGSAWDAAQLLAKSKQRQVSFGVVEHETKDEGEIITLSDVPVQFGPQKRYRDRRVTLLEMG